MKNPYSEEEIYAHTTSVDNLDKVLASGRLRSLKHIAKHEPYTELNVEPWLIPVRKKMKASDAYAAMLGTKGVDELFLTRNGYLPNYGDVVITKRLGKSARKSSHFNSIPEEYTTRRELSLRRNANVYVPDELVDTYTNKYRNVHFYPKSILPLKAYDFRDRASALKDKIVDKLLEKTSSDKDDRKHGNLRHDDEISRQNRMFKRLFGRNAHLVGSEALGIAVPGSSDTDVFVPYVRRHAYENAISRMAERYPELVLNEASRRRPDKKTFSGTVNGRQMDVVLGFGDKAKRFDEAFAAALDKLDNDSDRQKIVKRKQELKNAWFFPETRYKRYKKDLARELGLADAYF